jgi:exonuclease VII small subunit
MWFQNKGKTISDLKIKIAELEESVKIYEALWERCRGINSFVFDDYIECKSKLAGKKERLKILESERNTGLEVN